MYKAQCMKDPYTLIPTGAIIFDTIEHRKDKNRRFAHHALYYQHSAEIIHADVWHGITGRINGFAGWVQRQPLFQSDDTEAGGPFAADEPLYNAIVAHAKVPALQSALEKVLGSKGLVRTPFNYYSDRRQDNVQSEEHRQQLALFRAFRNAERIIHDHPISQAKGIDCGSFVGYVLKTAVILTLFPDGIPTHLSNAVYKIEQLRKAGPKKLDHVDAEHLRAFEQTFKKEIGKCSLDKPHQLMVEELSHSLKAQKLDLLYERMRAQTELWDVQVLVQVERPGMGPVAGISFDQAKCLPMQNICQTKDALQASAEAMMQQPKQSPRKGRL